MSSFMCPADCPPGWHRLGQKCYDAFTHPSALNSTYDARQICQNNGADLPTLANERVEVHIANIIATEVCVSAIIYYYITTIYILLVQVWSTLYYCHGIRCTTTQDESCYSGVKIIQYMTFKYTYLL